MSGSVQPVLTSSEISEDRGSGRKDKAGWNGLEIDNGRAIQLADVERREGHRMVHDLAELLKRIHTGRPISRACKEEWGSDIMCIGRAQRIHVVTAKVPGADQVRAAQAKIGRSGLWASTFAIRRAWRPFNVFFVFLILHLVQWVISSSVDKCALQLRLRQVR
jgi:hypothetical protein